MNVVSIAATNDQTEAAVTFFLLAAAITLVVMWTFYRLQRDPFFLRFQTEPFEILVLVID